MPSKEPVPGSPQTQRAGRVRAGVPSKRPAAPRTGRTGLRSEPRAAAAGNEPPPLPAHQPPEQPARLSTTPRPHPHHPSFPFLSSTLPFLTWSVLISQSIVIISASGQVLFVPENSGFRGHSLWDMNGIESLLSLGAGVRTEPGGSERQALARTGVCLRTSCGMRWQRGAPVRHPFQPPPRHPWQTCQNQSCDRARSHPNRTDHRRKM